MFAQALSLLLFAQALDPFTTPVLPCSRVETTFERHKSLFVVETTTPIKKFRVVRSSGPTLPPDVRGNVAVVSMRIEDVHDFFIEMEVTEECGETWTPRMRTLHE